MQRFDVFGKCPISIVGLLPEFGGFGGNSGFGGIGANHLQKYIDRLGGFDVFDGRPIGLVGLLPDFGRFGGIGANYV